MTTLDKVTKKQERINAKQDAVNDLLAILSPGDKVYTKLDHVSRSGMMRHISLYISENGDIINITHLAANAMGEKRADNGGIKIGGCGMDMGFSLVYSLGATLWPKGTDKPHGRRNGKPDTDGGYALNQQWL